MYKTHLLYAKISIKPMYIPIKSMYTSPPWATHTHTHTHTHIGGTTPLCILYTAEDLVASQYQHHKLADRQTSQQDRGQGGQGQGEKGGKGGQGGGVRMSSKYRLLAGIREAKTLPSMGVHASIASSTSELTAHLTPQQASAVASASHAADLQADAEAQAEMLSILQVRSRKMKSDLRGRGGRGGRQRGGGSRSTGHTTGCNG
jgi:hypothetical protein